jgi:hypothetical protein
MKRVVIAVDPGKASGICAFSIAHGGEPELLWSGEYQPEEYAQPLRHAIAEYAADSFNIEIVCERFTINAQTVRNSQAPYSLEQIGVLKQIMRDCGMKDTELKYQNPSDAKRMFPNEALKKLGYWHVGGGGHALDAIRHGLLFLAKNGWTPLRLLQ